MLYEVITTKNELVLTEINPFQAFSENDVLLFASLASREEDRDPIDDAVLARTKTLQDFSELAGSYRVLSFRPFDPVSKRTEAEVEDSAGNRFLVTKGAPQAVSALMGGEVGVDSKVTADSRNNFV